MKTILLVFFALSSLWAGDEQKEIEYPPEVRQFIIDAMNDEDARYQNIEKKLLATNKKEPHRDQKIEILSGIIWNIDRGRARALVDHIQSKELREEIRRQYKLLERANPSKEPEA